LGLIVAVIVLGAAGIATLTGYSSLSGAESSVKPDAAAAAKPDAKTDAAPAPATQDATSALPDIGAPLPPKDLKELTDDEFNAAMKLRRIGNPGAPLKLTEFASLSCPHCARFNKDVLPQIKKDYIDTGKVEYTFVDFPLNGPALIAAAAALCMPAESYFRYTDYLFQTQSDWVFANNIETLLAQDGKLLGADGDKLERCMASKRLKGAIADRFKKESEAFGIDATPGFVFNADKSTKFTGEMSYPDFKKVIEIELAKKNKGKASK
jgi:protein-disulfide isomerase